MPWLETVPVEERIQLIQDALSDRSQCRRSVPGTASVDALATSGWRGTKRTVGAVSRIEVGHPITVRIASMTSSLKPSVRSVESIRSGEHGSCSEFLPIDILE